MMAGAVSAMLSLVLHFVMELLQQVVLEQSVLQVVMGRWALLLSLVHQ